ncbi:MAG: helix-turn-helix transcriptional regulator [Oscillospiraceae bacterium]|nr:helix-turn-helix transcriptional regulator [Oscillospiraceae bacterium]
MSIVFYFAFLRIFMVDFCDRLKKLRLEKGTPQKDLSVLLGVSVRAYQFYESGDREPNIENINKLADFFEVSADYLLGRTDDPATR